jgi:hypothetical protein
MPGERPPLPGPGPVFDKIENFNFLMSRHDPANKTRQYSFDADTGLVPFGNVSMDYDQTEGMGGLSVSSYESIDDDRSSLDLRYPYQGTCQALRFVAQRCICYAIAPLLPLSF